jgi:hypothetical protein
MAATLTSTGIIFGDSTVANSKYYLVGINTSMPFFQAVAPTGWTKSTTSNDTTLRVVSGTGGVASPASWATNFSTAFPLSLTPISGSAAITATSLNGSNTTESTTLTAAQIPIHAHTDTFGSDGAHTHPYLRQDTQPDASGFQPTSGRDRTAPNLTDAATTTNNPHSHPVSIAAQGGNGSHFHPWTLTSAPFSTNIDLRVQYCDIIICSFN